MRDYIIRSDQNGIRATLWDLEADIMEAVWDHGWEEFAVCDVHESLQQTREIAYTTVMTTVCRLFDKGLLDRRKDGRRYLYRPMYSRAEFLRELTRDVLERLPDPCSEEAIAYLVERVEDADSGTLDRLEALIARRRAEIEGEKS